jgi:hypothetical protein
MLPRKTFGHKSEDYMRWENIHDEGLKESYSSLNIRMTATSEMIRGTRSTHGVKEIFIKTLS